MQKKNLFLLSLLLFLVSCEDDKERLAELGYGKETPYATGVLKPTVISYSGNKLIFDFNFIVFDQDGIVPQENFELIREEAVFSNGTRMTFDLLSMDKVTPASQTCYDATIMMEHNAMERPERLEVASRYIFKNTPECSQFNLAFYPERNDALEITDPYRIERSRFINDKYEFDELLASISYQNFFMYQQNVDIDNSTQLEALNAVLLFTAEKSTAPSKHIIMMYENYTDETSAELENLKDFAVSNNIRININKNYEANDDAMLRVAYETGGIYFLQEEYDFFQPRNKPDSYVMALHADDFFSGNYQSYRARYEVTTTGQSFASDYWFRLAIRIQLPNEVSKQLPLYVYIP